MSVSSVRNAVKAAVADKKVTKAEAEKITQIASRTSGISAGEKKEIAKALDADVFFDPGAKAKLQAAAATGPAPSASGAKALEQLVNSKGLAVLDGLKPANPEKLGDKVNAALEKFAGILGNSDGETLASNARELKVGKDTLYVVSDYDGDKDRELVGFFSKDGQELGRAAVWNKPSGVKMTWEALGGKALTTAIKTPPSAAEVKLPATFKKDLEKFVTDNYGELGGKELEAKDMPVDVRRHYQFMERTCSDTVGAEKLEFQGQTLYALHDYSCVSSVHLYTEDGKRVLYQTE
jgi:hypothetical protein